MSQVSLIPMPERVIVKFDEYSDSGLIIHAGTWAFQAPNRGTVRFVGKKGRELGINVGDKVHVEQYTGAPWTDKTGEQLKILHVKDVLGILETIESS